MWHLRTPHRRPPLRHRPTGDPPAPSTASTGNSISLILLDSIHADDGTGTSEMETRSNFFFQNDFSKMIEDETIWKDNALTRSGWFSVCSETCPEAGYYAASSRRCEPCHAACSSCYGPGPDHCLRCADNFNAMVDKNLCAESCPESYHFGQCRFFYI